MTTIEDVGLSGPLDGECGLFVVLEGAMDIVVRKAAGEVVRHASAGYAAFLSGDSRRSIVRMAGRARVAAVHVPPEWFARLSVQATVGDTKPIPRDETIKGLVSAMCDEIARDASTGRLYAESLSTALLSYALKNVSPRESAARGALSDAQCRCLRTYIRERLAEDLSLYELAHAVGLGARHFSRLFRSSFGTSPHQYVIHERLKEAARLLERGDRGVSDIAISVGFANQSHFTVAFRRGYGVTPRRWKGLGVRG